MISYEEYEIVMIERHTKEVYNVLKNSKVAIAGLGGLGSNIAISLARAGVGQLLLVDFDKVDLTNLGRQQYEIDDIGRFKTEALKDKLLKINPYLSITIKTLKVTEENVTNVFKDYRIICEAFDLAEMKAMLVNAILSSFADRIIVSGSGMAGISSSNTIKTKKIFDNLYICGDGESDCKTESLMAPRVAICANHQANMVLRLLLNKKEI